MWDKLIQRLRTEIDWSRAEQSQQDALNDILGSMPGLDQECARRFDALLNDERELRDYLPHFEYPRPAMHKFVLHMNDSDAFRVRLHKFPRIEENLVIEPYIHDHRWLFSSLILSGEYEEIVYDVVDCDWTKRTSKIAERTRRVFRRGDVNSSLPRIPHSTINPKPTQDCYTLFVRGPSMFKNSRVFNLNDDTFVTNAGLHESLLLEADMFREELGRLEHRPDAHAHR